MKTIVTFCLMVCSITLALAQKEVSISANPEQEAYQLGLLGGEWPVMAVEKSGCVELEADVISVLAEQTIWVGVEIDTFGLGADGYYECLNCASLAFGQGSLVLNAEGNAVDSIMYQANAGVQIEVEDVEVRYCNSTGSECSDVIVTTFLARRAGESISLPVNTLAQGEVVDLTAPLNLPGELRCNFFYDCLDNYEGRDQIAYFRTYDEPTTDFVYKASRYAGDDAVCLVLCDEFGICDTTNYTFRINVPVKLPPVYDDFSYEGPVASTDLWLDEEVFVNNTMALNPPSIGVATFDGLDYRGRPYGAGEGYSDRLTSTYLDTRNNDWRLSFWLERGGMADRPEQQDSLVLQFKNDNGDWVSVRNFEGMAASLPFSVKDTFQFYSEPLTEMFQHDEFQFRFINYSDRRGLRDNWHLDYVRLDDEGTEIFNDIAFTASPKYILANYSSMPWRHFQPQLNTTLSETIDVGVYNHFATTQNVSPSSVSLVENSSGINPFGVVPTLFNGLESNVEAGMTIHRSYNLMGDETGFSNVWSDYVMNMLGAGFGTGEELVFEQTYRLQNTSQANIDFVNQNDEVSSKTVFSNYFSYDDGSAESALETSPGKQIAVAYETGEDDLLQGVRLHFPHTNGDITDQTFRLNIWVGELDGTPEYSMPFQPAYATAYFDTLQGFTSYPLIDEAGDLTPLDIPAGLFYVGWQQASNCEFGSCIAVGYDRNQPQGKDFIYVENGNGWEEIFGVSDGALMLRPVMNGGEPVLPTEVKEAPLELKWGVYPNPAGNYINIQTLEPLAEFAEIFIFNNTGQLVHQQTYSPVIDITQLNAGVYTLKVELPEGSFGAPQRLIVIK